MGFRAPPRRGACGLCGANRRGHGETADSDRPRNSHGPTRQCARPLDHRSCGARRQLAHARAAWRRPADAPRWSRPNAYGIGLDRAAPALWAAGARTFFVAHLGEGLAARRLLPAEAEIYVLNGLEAGADPADYVEHRLKPAIGSAGELERWSAFATRKGRLSPSALHLDTGMRRLGFNSLKALNAAVERNVKASRTDLLMSHFVSSEIPNDPLNAVQIVQFEAARAAFPHLAASLANSSGIFLPARPIYDLARPGYALYGGNPTPGRSNPMRPVVTLTVAVQQTRWIRAWRELRLQRPVDGEAPHAAWDAARGLRRWPAARGRRDRRTARAPRSQLRDGVARWSDGCRWTSSSPT